MVKRSSIFRAIIVIIIIIGTVTQKRCPVEFRKICFLLSGHGEKIRENGYVGVLLGHSHRCVFDQLVSLSKILLFPQRNFLHFSRFRDKKIDFWNTRSGEKYKKNLGKASFYIIPMAQKCFFFPSSFSQTQKNAGNHFFASRHASSAGVCFKRWKLAFFVGPRGHPEIEEYTVRTKIPIFSCLLYLCLMMGQTFSLEGQRLSELHERDCVKLWKKNCGLFVWGPIFPSISLLIQLINGLGNTLEVTEQTLFNVSSVPALCHFVTLDTWQPWLQKYTRCRSGRRLFRRVGNPLGWRNEIIFPYL